MNDPSAAFTPPVFGGRGGRKSSRRRTDEQREAPLNDWRCCHCSAVHSPSIITCESREAPCRHLLCESCVIQRGASWDTDDAHQNRGERDIWQCCKCRIRGNAYEEGVGEDRCRSSYGSRCSHAKCHRCESITPWQEQRWREHYAALEQRRLDPGFPAPRVRLAELYNTTIDRYEGPDLWGNRAVGSGGDTEATERRGQELPRRYGRGSGSGPGLPGAGSCRDDHRHFGGRH